MCALQYNQKMYGFFYGVFFCLLLQNWGKKDWSKQKYIIWVWKQISEKATQVFKGAKANQWEVKEEAATNI